MNIKNNQRYQENEEKMQRVFLDLLQEKSFNKITVRDICEKAQVNRSTFYTHYLDMIDLLEKTQMSFQKKMTEVFVNTSANQTYFSEKKYLEMSLEKIKEDKLFYQVYFHGLGNRYMNWGVDVLVEKKFIPELSLQDESEKENFRVRFEFFKAGMFSGITYWLDHDCQMPVKEICDILWEYYPVKK